MKITTVNVQFIGRIWQPGFGPCAKDLALVISHLAEQLSREVIADALGRRPLGTGDFSTIEDFRAEWREFLGTCDCCGQPTHALHVIDWAEESSADTYAECMFPSEG